MAEALDPPTATQVMRDGLLLVNPIGTLQDDDATVDLFLGILEAAPPWTNPGRLGEWSADVAWVNDDERTTRWKDLRQRCLAIAFEQDLAWSPTRVREAADAMPNAEYTMIGSSSRRPPHTRRGRVHHDRRLSVDSLTLGSGRVVRSQAGVV